MGPDANKETKAGKTHASSIAFLSLIAIVLISLTAAAVCIEEPQSYGADGDNALITYEDCKYRVLDADNNVEIASPRKSGISNFNIPASFEVDGITYNVVRVGESAFANDTLFSITLPNTIKSIEDSAFCLCIYLTDINLPEGLEKIGSGAFMSCAFLSIGKLPSTLKEIGDAAFCLTSASDVTIPANLEKIGYGAFSECFLLEKFKSDSSKFPARDGILYNSDMTEIVAYPAGKSAVSFEIPSDVTSVGDGAFWGSALEEITYHENLERIGKYAFAQCFSLITFKPCDCADDGCTISSHVNTVGESAFSGCDGMKYLTVESKNIGESAFEECTSLKIVYISDNVESIGKNAFKLIYNGTLYLSSLYVSDNENLNISDQFDFKFYEDDGKTEISDLNETKGRLFKNSNKIAMMAVVEEKKKEIELGEPLEFIGIESVDKVFLDTTKIFGITNESGSNYYEYDKSTKTLTVYINETSVGKHYLTVYDEKDNLVVHASVNVKVPTPPTPIIIISYEVSYDVNGGSEPIPGTMRYEENDVAYVATYTGYKAGYTFGGWSCNGQIYKAGDTFAVNSDMKFTAVWNAVPGPSPEPSPSNDLWWIGVVVAVAVIILAAAGIVYVKRR